MEGFKKLPKMQCFKAGGSVAPKFKSVVEKTTAVKPTGNKLANAKSAAVAPKEKEAPVELAAFKKGGRSKKSVGTVKKFAAAPSKAATKPNFKGSDVKKEKSKPSGDKDAIKKVKPTGNKKAAAPSKGAVKGKEIKKFADGGLTGPSADEAARGFAGLGNDLPFENYNTPKQQGFNLNPGNTFNNANNMNANVNGGGGYGLGAYPYPNQYQTPQQPGSNTFNNTNTMNANVSGGDNGLGGLGGGGWGGPTQQPMANLTTDPYNGAPIPPQTASAPQSSVNLLPGLFGGK